MTSRPPRAFAGHTLGHYLRALSLMHAQDGDGAFFECDRAIPLTLTQGPLTLTQGKASILVRFVPDPDHTAGPVFGVRLFTAEAAAA